MRASVVLNVESSRTERHLAQLPRLLSARGIEATDVAVAADEPDLRKAVKRAVKRGARLVLVGGGDGSMTTAADVLAHSDVALGVLPLGTGNSFALTLGIGDDLTRALDVIAGGRTAHVDLGVVDGTHFANFATIGLSAEIGAAAPHALKRLIGPAAYVAGAVGPFWRARPFSARVRWDGGRRTLLTQQIVIASGRFFGRKPVTPDASIVDDRLTFFTTSGTSRLAVARMYLAFGLGWQTRLPDAFFFASEKISVKTWPKAAVSIDGNSFGKTPARFHIARRALRVCVPREFDAND